MSEPVPEKHRAHAPRRLGFAVVTVSDSRTAETDESGALIERLLRAAGHEVHGRVVVRDELAAIRAAVEKFAAAREVDCVITNGGTGIGPRDVTIEALRPLLAKELPGFGEALRALSDERVGSAATLTRATCGTLPSPGGARIVFALPGAPDACEVAVTRLILPEAAHMVAVANPARAH